MTDTTLTLSRLWRRMTLEQRVQVARSFWLDDQAADDQIQAAIAISQHKKFRPKTVVSLDTEQKARHLASLASLPDALVARTLIVYHLAEQRPMMAAFLDTLGIEHDKGVIDAEGVVPDADRLAGAVASLASQFPRGSVALYLSTLLAQDPDTWKGLAGRPELDLSGGLTRQGAGD